MSDIKEKTASFLAKYGEKGLLVLKSAVEVAEDPYVDHRLGDFDYKRLYLKLLKSGFNYAPQNLLRILEKDYGVIERTYTSSNQKWWRFVDIDAVKEAIEEYIGSPSFDDPRATLLRIKYRSLDPVSLLNNLKRLLVKDKLTASDKEFFQKLVFETLEKAVSILREMMEYGDVFNEEINVLNEVLKLADAVSRRIYGLRGGGVGLAEYGESVISEAKGLGRVRNRGLMDNE